MIADVPGCTRGTQVLAAETGRPSSAADEVTDVSALCEHEPQIRKVCGAANSLLQTILASQVYTPLLSRELVAEAETLMKEDIERLKARGQQRVQPFSKQGRPNSSQASRLDATRRVTQVNLLTLQNSNSHTVLCTEKSSEWTKGVAGQGKHQDETFAALAVCAVNNP